jgi:hypothetical protein
VRVSCVHRGKQPSSCRRWRSRRRLRCNLARVRSPLPPRRRRRLSHGLCRARLRTISTRAHPTGERLSSARMRASLVAIVIKCVRSGLAAALLVSNRNTAAAAAALPPPLAPASRSNAPRQLPSPRTNAAAATTVSVCVVMHAFMCHMFARLCSQHRRQWHDRNSNRHLPRLCRRGSSTKPYRWCVIHACRSRVSV